MTKTAKLCATGCGRTAYVGDLCKTHHVKGPEYQIRTYSQRGEGRVEYAGIPVLRQTRDALVRAEKRAEKAARTLVGAILDAWAAGKIWGPMLARAGIGVAMVCALVGGAAGLRCVTPPRAGRDAVLTKPMPDKPLSGQAVPPCSRGLKEISGACWGMLHDPETGKQMRGCLEEEQIYQDKDGYCWLPAPSKKPRRPSATDPEVKGGEYEGFQ